MATKKLSAWFLLSEGTLVLEENYLVKLFYEICVQQSLQKQFLQQEAEPELSGPL